MIGSAARDLTAAVARFPAPGETITAGAFAVGPGGKGSNQAVRAALAGASVALLAVVGRDRAGALLRTTWRAAGVDDGAVREAAATPTGQALILRDAAGENCIVVIGGANLTLSPADADAQRDRLSRARLVIGQLETPLAATTAAFRWARSGGAATLLNAAPATGPVDAEILRLTDLLVVNALEASTLAGVAADAPIVQAAARLTTRGPHAVVVTLGAAGAFLYETDGRTVHWPTPTISPVDTTGAGDAFIGAFAAAHVQGRPLVQCVERAVEAGAEACMHHGALPPDLADASGTSDSDGVRA